MQMAIIAKSNKNTETAAPATTAVSVFFCELLAEPLPEVLLAEVRLLPEVLQKKIVWKVVIKAEDRTEMNQKSCGSINGLLYFYFWIDR